MILLSERNRSINKLIRIGRNECVVVIRSKSVCLKVTRKQEPCTVFFNLFIVRAWTGGDVGQRKHRSDRKSDMICRMGLKPQVSSGDRSRTLRLLVNYEHV
ncbi:hypothetical protein F2P81_025055 [Scophthalmus maximus]|uniref:Uncharacterized protein n=1 Tax=Scophthalmus maximus TaxID=52904 RepID=A0A6A4RLD1_SCOMX|nr:hypothetical protein F2P81_025055 [Scophthalmus maximus]